MDSISMKDQNRIWPAPAKINVFLHIVGKRADAVSYTHLTLPTKA